MALSRSVFSIKLLLKYFRSVLKHIVEISLLRPANTYHFYIVVAEDIAVPALKRRCQSRAVGVAVSKDDQVLYAFRCPELAKKAGI